MNTINDLPEKLKTQLYNFQKLGVDFGISRKGRILLADEMGVGKTVQAIAIASLYRDDWPVLILCPCSVKYIWRDELMYWLDSIKLSDIQILRNGKQTLDSYAKFYIFSYDLAMRMEDKIINKRFRFGIADEAH